jgi:hypothetical protein
VGYDASDSIARLLVERIALNGRDAGLVLHPSTAGNVDLRLVRIPITSSELWVALGDIASFAGLSVPKNSENATEDLYAAEQALLVTQRLIPLFHLPVAYAPAKTLEDWSLGLDGSWRLADAWLMGGTHGNEKPGSERSVNPKP